MTTSRWGLLAGLVAVLVALTSWWPGSTVSTTDEFVAAALPAGGRADALSSTWYCAAGSVGGESPAALQQLVIMNPSGENTSALVSLFGADGPVQQRTVEVTAPGPLRLNLNEMFEVAGVAAMVESPGGELVVEHSLTSGNAHDQVPCASSASHQWFFPSQTTVRGTTATLALFNPFSSDAGVDISAAVEDGVRLPGPWQGLIVPARTVRLVDLSTEIQVRDQFALSVQTRTGRVVAETVQTLATEADDESGAPATSGLRMQLGVAQPSDQWVFANGVVDAAASEQLVVYNPGDDGATVAVQVTPYGAADQPPEPFQFDVPARRYNVLDLSAESRIPTQGFHAITVESDPATPVVVGRVLTLTGPPPAESTDEVLGRSPLGSGTAIGTGSPMASRLWLATGLVPPPAQGPIVFVHNPGDGITTVSVVVIGGEADGSALADGVEINGGDSLAVPLPASLGGAELSVVVEAADPVVVERSSALPSRADFTLGNAVPLRPQGEAFVQLSARA